MQKATGGFLAVICEGQPVVAFQATSRSEALILPARTCGANATIYAATWPGTCSNTPYQNTASSASVT